MKHLFSALLAAQLLILPIAMAETLQTEAPAAPASGTTSSSGSLNSSTPMTGPSNVNTSALPASPAGSRAGSSSNPPKVIQGQATWQEMTPDSEEAALNLNPDFPDKAWWLQFNDPYLTRYIDEALKANHNIEIASLRLAEAQDVVRQSVAREFPHIAFAPSFSRQHIPANLLPFDFSGTQSQGSGIPGGGGLGSLKFPGMTFNTYTVPLQANWELDLTGKNRLAAAASRSQAEASAQEQRGVLISVITETASAYFNLLRADAYLEQGRILEGGYLQVLAIRKSQYDTGLISEDQLLQDQKTLDEIRAFIADSRKQQALFAHQLAVLTGRPPESESQLPRAALADEHLPAVIPAGEPSALVARRPDILAAEANLATSRIQVSIARRAFFPNINLNGQFGFASIHLHNLFSWDSYLASVAASLSQTILDFGEKKAQLHLERSRYREQIEQYQQTVLNSFLEVENAIASLKGDHAAWLAADHEAMMQRDLLGLSKSRVDAGLDPELDAILAHGQMVRDEQKVAQEKGDTLIDLLSLYKALGGGF